MRKIIFSLFITIMLVLASCTKKSVDVYSPDEVGKIMQIKEGKLINSRLVLISGLDADKENWGSIIGAVVAGTTVYGITEGDNPLEKAGIIIAVIGGALAGTFIEEQKNTTDGVEYTINMNNGKTIVVVQAISDKTNIIANNSPVSLVFSNSGSIRVIEN